MNEFFSWQFLATLAGATLAVVIITNVLRDVTGYSAKWVAFVVAVVVQGLVWSFTAFPQWDKLVIALLNAFLVYAGATGLNQIGYALSRRGVEAAEGSGWWQPWW